MIGYLNPAAAVIFAAIAVYTIYGYGSSAADQSPAENDRRFDIASCGMMLVGAVLRLAALGQIPYGVHQDEASIGYDAFTLAQYGMDRNGYVWPVYPVTWGSGGGSPLMVYLTAFATKLFGRSPFTLRLAPAVTGVLTLIVFWLILKKLHGSLTAFLGTGFLSVCPWHIIQSRWALDSNTTPFWVCLATLLLLIAFETGKTWQFLLSAAVYSLCLAAYGSATVVIPLYLLAICIYAIRHGRLKLSQMILSMIVFMVVFSPLLLFYLVNYLDLPEIRTAWFSVPKLTASRSVFYSPSDIVKNIPFTIRYLALTLTKGWDEVEISVNYIPGFATLFAFTFPLTLTGLIGTLAGCLGKKKAIAPRENYDDRFCPEMTMVLMFVISLLFTFMIEPDINRMTLVFMPLIYFFAVGLRMAAARGKMILGGAALILAAAAVLFTKAYFGSEYRNFSSEAYMPGYGEACRYAESLWDEGEMIYSTYSHLSAPSMIALYSIGEDLEEFMNTVVYKDPNAEFRIAASFGHYSFGLPEDILEDKYADDILIIHQDDKSMFDEDKYEITDFGDFAVAVIR